MLLPVASNVCQSSRIFYPYGARGVQTLDSRLSFDDVLHPGLGRNATLLRTSTHLASVTLPCASPRGHRRLRPTVEAWPNGRERPVHDRRPHTRCWAAACATRRMGLMGSESGGSAAGAPIGLSHAYLSPQYLLRRQKEGVQRAWFHGRGDAKRPQPSSVSQTFPICVL